eukprot:Awhi_evm1s2557
MLWAGYSDEIQDYAVQVGADLYVFGDTSIPEVVYRVQASDSFLNAKWENYINNNHNDEHDHDHEIHAKTAHFQKLKLLTFGKMMEYDSLVFLDSDVFVGVNCGYNDELGSIFDDCKLSTDTNVIKHCLYNHGTRHQYIPFMRTYYNSSMIYEEKDKLTPSNGFYVSLENIDSVIGEDSAQQYVYFNSGIMGFNRKGIMYFTKYVKQLFEIYDEKKLDQPVDWDQTIFNILWLGGFGPAYRDGEILQITLLPPEYNWSPMVDRQIEITELYGSLKMKPKFLHLMGEDKERRENYFKAQLDECEAGQNDETYSIDY